MSFHKKGEVGEVDVRHNSPSKAVHLSMGSRKLLHLDWNIEYSDVHFSCIFSTKLNPPCWERVLIGVEGFSSSLWMRPDVCVGFRRLIIYVDFRRLMFVWIFGNSTKHN